MDEGFTIKCNKCGNVIKVYDDTNNSDYNGEIDFIAVQSKNVSIVCECENEVNIVG